MRKIAWIFVICLSMVMQAAAQTDTDARITFGSLDWSSDGKTLLFTTMKVKSDYSDYSPDKWTLFLFDANTRALTLLENGVMRASFGPKDKKIAYSQFVDGQWDIYISKLKTGKPQNITGHSSRDASPSWGPNNRIFFNSDRDGTVEIYQMKANGEGLQRLTSSGTFKSYNPEVSPDGSRICYYFEKGDNKDQIYLLDLSTGKSTNLSNDDQHSFYPGWLDNQTLIFARRDQSIWTMKMDGRNKKPVEQVKSFMARARPKSRTLSFVDPEKGTIELLDRETREIQVLISKAELARALSTNEE